MSFVFYNAAATSSDPDAIFWSFFNSSWYSMIPFILFIHQLFHVLLPWIFNPFLIHNHATQYSFQTVWPHYILSFFYHLLAIQKTSLWWLHTHTHTQPFYGSLDFVRDNPGEPVPGETFTHSHSSWSSIIPVCFLHLLQSMASSLFNQCALQSFSTISLQVFFGLPLGLVPSTSYSIHLFTQSLSSFRNTCPYNHNLFCCSTEIMSSNTSLPLNSLLGTPSCNFTPHIILPFSSLTSEVPPHFPFLQAILTSMQHTASHTTAVQSPSHCQWYILIGKQRYQLPEFIPSNSNFMLLKCMVLFTTFSLRKWHVRQACIFLRVARQCAHLQFRYILFTKCHQYTWQTLSNTVYTAALSHIIAYIWWGSQCQ